MTTYTITKDGKKTNHTTANGFAAFVGLEFLKETHPESTWSIITEEIEEANASPQARMNALAESARKTLYQDD